MSEDFIQRLVASRSDGGAAQEQADLEKRQESALGYFTEIASTDANALIAEIDAYGERVLDRKYGKQSEGSKYVIPPMGLIKDGVISEEAAREFDAKLQKGRDQIAELNAVATAMIEYEGDVTKFNPVELQILDNFTAIWKEVRGEVLESTGLSAENTRWTEADGERSDGQQAVANFNIVAKNMNRVDVKSLTPQQGRSL